jgi:DNA gyrase/topoisomerase IV subunit A
MNSGYSDEEKAERRWGAGLRLQIIDAQLLAQDKPTDLISIVSSTSEADALGAVSSHFGVTREQAIAMLNFQVRRFSPECRATLADERAFLKAEVARLQ